MVIDKVKIFFLNFLTISTQINKNKVFKKLQVKITTYLTFKR